jgi:hypothetical protein
VDFVLTCILAAPSKRRSPKTGPLPDSVGPSKAVPISQIGDTSLGRDSSAKISPRTDQSEGHMQPSREEGEISTLECNLSQGEHFLREMNYLWDGGDTYGLTDGTSPLFVIR